MKFKTTLFAVLLAGMSFAQIQFPPVSSKGEVEQNIGFTEVEVEYYRPNVNNRKIFGGIIPYGEVWRTGANNNTVIKFNTDVLIEEKPLLKGEYALYTIPNQKSWDIIFYSTTDNWGNPKEWNESLVALKVNVPVYPLSESVETFEIGFEKVTTNSANLFLKWDKTSVKAKINVPTNQIVTNNISTQLNESSSGKDFYGAANFYYTEKLDLNKAYEWIKKALLKTPNAPQYYKDLKIKIEQELNK